MDDLLLFELLRDRHHDDERLPGLLRELCELPARARVPYLAWMHDLASDDAMPIAIRTPATRAMEGADGILPLEVAITALDSPDTAMMQAGIAVLRSAASRRPARMAHLLFHPRLEVREAALREGAPVPNLEFHLLADPALREVVRSRGATRDAPKGTISAVLDFHERGFLDRVEARRLVALHAVEIPVWAQGVRERRPEIVGEYLASAKRPEGPNAELLRDRADDLDLVLDLFWEDPPPDFFPNLARIARGQNEGRFACALLHRLTVTGVWPKGAGGALATLHPDAFDLPWVTTEQRRMMLADIHAMSPTTPKRTAAEVTALLGKPFASHADGTPDLWTIAALLHLAPSDPYKALLDAIPAERIDSALSRRPAESAPILFVPDDKGRRRVLEIVARTVRLALLVRFAIDAPDVLLPFLVEIDGDATGLLAPVAGRGWSELLCAVMAHPIPEERIERLADLCKPDAYKAILDAWLAGPTLPGRALGFAIITRAAIALDADTWVALAKTADKKLPVLLEAISTAQSFPWPKEKALALALADRDNEIVRKWALARTPVEERPMPPPKLTALTGVAEEVSRATARPNDVETCVRLLGSKDPIADTLRELARFGSGDDDFRSKLDRAMVDAYAYREVALSPLGHAWLWRWDRHGACFADAWPLAYGESFEASIRGGFALEPTWVRWEVQSALANLFAFLAARDPGRLAMLATDAVCDALVGLLAGDGGLRAANALAVLHKTAETQTTLSRVLPRLRLVLPDLEDPVRLAISGWIDSEGLPPKRAAKAPEPELDSVTLDRIRAMSDLDELVRLASQGARVRIVHEATLRLMDFGERGQVALLGLLASSKAADVEVRRPIVESVSLWADGESVRWVSVFCNDIARPPELRFRLAIALAERGIDTKEALLRAALEPTDDRWLMAEDWDKAARHVDPGVLALALAPSPHPHAHLRAVEHILAKDASVEGAKALRAFLATGTKRMGSLRRRAALHLFERGDHDVFPLVIEQYIDDLPKADLLPAVSFRLAALAVRSIIMCAPNMAKEPTAQKHLSALSIFDIDVQDLWAWVAEHATVDAVRSKAVSALGRSGMRARRVRAIAEAFAWGQDRSRELTGRVFTMQMTGGKGLGFTRFRENKVHISPMPILRGDPRGSDVMRALILHELGHHMYHRGRDREKVWAEAQKEGIHGLLNLVADEHLERNVRAIDAEYGDLLKRLAAYAFQHAEREIKLDTLLYILQGRAFEVLTGTKLGVARDPDSVKVDSGALLRTMERSELPFARFIRALRMGLGNRSGDPLVEQGLDLFRERFRKGEMESLLDIARQLRALYGWQVKIVEHFGTHESLEEGEEDGSWWGISEEEIEREVERVREPQQRRTDLDGKPGGRPWINVQPKTHFDKITQVKKMPYDASAHAPYAKRVERNAHTLRRYLEELGLSLKPVKARVVGNRIDTSRLRALVLRGDPRVLMSRAKHISADVFIGIVIDCSGSMASRGNMERAKHFAVLIAEAAATLRGVDVRVFGFTDKIIYDCGDARRCAAHTLQATGGNNDAAALWHAANVAKASQRRAKLLVMISDGLPTECSVAALKGLVDLLTRRERMVCAQVAVQPLTEVCFPHYVVVQDEDADVAVRKFGEILVRLVGRAIAA
jgi:hypothetical protein